MSDGTISPWRAPKSTFPWPTSRSTFLLAAQKFTVPRFSSLHPDLSWSCLPRYGAGKGDEHDDENENENKDEDSDKSVGDRFGDDNKGHSSSRLELGLVLEQVCRSAPIGAFLKKVQRRRLYSVGVS